MPEIGDIRYVVYKAPDGEHWIGRVEMAGFTPKRTKCRWRELDTAERSQFTDKAEYGARTPDEAIDKYQVWSVYVGFLNGVDGPRNAVRNILAAEKLRGAAERGRD